MAPKDIRGGIGYRYVGLYGSLVKDLMNRSPQSKVFWYSHSDQSVRIISRSGCERLKANLLEATMNAISSTLKNGTCLAVIIAHPYAVPRIRRIFKYILVLLVWKIFSVERVRVIVDYFDPPVEAAYAFSEVEPSTLEIIYGRMLDMLTLKVASSIITLSDFWKQHIARIYRIRKEKIFLVPNGSLVRYIRYKPPEHGKILKILYAGSAMKVKDVDKLVSACLQLRKKGYCIDLYIAGAKRMCLPQWVHVAQHDWPSFVDGILLQSDICVIPYPPNRLTFFHAVPAKLFDYMAAGKPVVSTNLKEVGDIIRTFNCGLVVKDWEEFVHHLERLHRDRELAKEFGKNGRRAAEKYFDYEILAKALLEKLARMFKGEH